MFSRAPIATLFFALCLTGAISAQETAVSSSDSTNSTITALEGKVLGADGHPVPGIHVELDEASTALPVASTYTREDGTFQLYNLPKGHYEVIAESSDLQVSDEEVVQMDRPTLELRLRRAATGNDTDAVTSIARILVPARAQKDYRRAREAFSQGKNDEAEKLLDQALIIESHFPEALALRALIHMQSSDLEEAETYLEKAVHVDPYYSPAYMALGAVYNHEGRFDDAMRASERGIALSPRSWQGYFEMAKASVAEGMYEQALKLARQAQRLGGNGFVALHLVKASALLPLKLYTDARYEVQAVLSHAPKGTNVKEAQSLLAEIEAADQTTTAAAR
jgi:tetratricopeptide (TPR) repeat protein